MFSRLTIIASIAVVLGMVSVVMSILYVTKSCGPNVPATGKSVLLHCMSLNILTSGKDLDLTSEEKFERRKDAIKDFIMTSNFHLIALQEVSLNLPQLQSQFEWLKSTFGDTYTIYGRERLGINPELTPVMVQKGAGLTVEDSATEDFMSGPGVDTYPRIFTWVKATASNGVKLLFISTQMHRKDEDIDNQKLDIAQLSRFIKVHNDHGARHVIAVGDWNPTASKYLPFDDLAKQTSLVYTPLGRQSGSTGTRPKQPTNTLNKTQYTTTTTATGGFQVNVGGPFDVFVFSPPPLIVAYNAPNRYMRAVDEASTSLFSLSDHDPICATFVL